MTRFRLTWLLPFAATGVTLFALLTLVLAANEAVAEPTPGAAPTATGRVDFVREIRPIFESACYKCHDGAKHKGGLRLDAKTTAFVGGDSGDPSIVIGDPDHSKIIPLVRGDDPKSVMPPKGERLTVAQIALLTRWIEQGANWPDGVDRPAEALKHWSFSKPVRGALPAVKQAGWCRNAVDRFVLSKLEKEGLAPSPEADRYTLCRRLYLDLIGLPPTPAAAEEFARDSSPHAYEKLVDELQANTHYGERWARLWLDCARYADSAGYGSDPLRKTCYRYRDWVINALNRNMPFDQFTVDQLAGDLLTNPTTDQLIATGFNRNTMTNTEGGTDAEEFRTAAVKDRVETSVQVWMGLTVGCAQCHTHKYDPITNREYYQLFALFNQTEDANRGDESPTIPTPSAEDDRTLATLKSKIEVAEKKLKDRAAWTTAEEKWEKTLAGRKIEWVTLEADTVSSSGGTTLTKQEDGSILATGKLAESDTYTLTAHVDLKQITAFRLEALPDAARPKVGVGRDSAGGFVLSQFNVAVVPSQSSALRGRYVRIQLPGRKKLLHLAQVQVFSGSDNLARNGSASQSTTGFGGKAEFAIDGNTDGDFKKHMTSHTAESDDPWWEVDLGALHDLDKIVIWNRTDGGSESRLADFNVIVSDENRKPVWETHIVPSPRPSLELDLHAPRAIPLKDASDSLHIASETGSAASLTAPAEKGKRAEWVVNSQQTRTQTAIFPTTAAVSGPATLTFTLAQNVAHASMGRFRLSVTTAPQPIRVLPHDVEDALATEDSVRTDEQKDRVFTYFSTIAPQLAKEREQIAKLQKELAAFKPSVTAIMREMPKDRRRESHVLIKGNFLIKGPKVEPAVLAAFNPLPSGTTADRLGLAKWFLDQDNPLTARVEVNRYWAALFGIGIVETQEDFGTQGQLPSNQELLDYLAVEFRDPQKCDSGVVGAASQSGTSLASHLLAENGHDTCQPWDMKRLVKMMVMSAAYRQSSRVSAEALEKDPRNRWISRGPRRRLEAELVRDQALALSGLLSEKMLGPSVFPVQPDGLWQAAFNGERTWPTSTGEDKYRRGVYVFWRRTVPYPSMSAFDAPSREVCTLRRVPTSTPLQAFVTLNDPVYVEASQALARRIVKEGGSLPEERAIYALRLCLGHPPESQQTARMVELYKDQFEHYGSNPTDAKKMATEPIGPAPEGMKEDDLAAWTVCANVLLNLDGVLTNH